MNRLLLTLILAASALAAPAALAQRMPVTTTSDDARVHYVRGLHAFSHADAAGGLVHMDAALAADPRFAMAHLYHAVATPVGRAEHMRLASARSARASESERQTVEAYAANLRGDPVREIALLTALADQYPGDPFPMFTVANAEMNRDDPAASVAAARRALVADPAFAGAYNLIGYAEVARGDLPAAERAFREYIRMAPDEPNPYDSFGEFYLNQGRLDEAEAQYEMALTRDSGFDNSRTMLARIGIERASLRFERAVARRDADAVAALYTPNAVLLPPDGSPVAGRAAIREYFAGMVAAGVRDLDLRTVEVVRFDDFALERADVAFRVGDGAVENGKSLVLWRLVDGEWLLARDMWNANAPATTASN